MKGKINLCHTDLSEANIKESQQITSHTDKLRYAKFPRIDIKDMKKIIDIKISKKWNDTWNRANNKCKLRQIKQNVFDKNPATIFKRQDQVLITRLRFGHTKITHQHLLSNEINRLRTLQQI